MAQEDPAVDAVLGAFGVALAGRGSRLVVDGELDPVLEANSRSILAETFAGAGRMVSGDELDLVSVDYSTSVDLKATGTLRATQNLHPAESLMAAEVLFGVALPLVVARLGEESQGDVDAVAVARILHHAVWRRFPPGAIAYVEIIRDRLSSAHQDSRRRVSRELHDRVAHGILAGLQRVELAGLDGADAGRAHLAEAAELLRGALADVQDMAVELRQLVGSRTLDAAIADYLVDSEAVSDRVVVETRGASRELPAATSDEVFAIVREAIRNARDHASGATQIVVMLDWSDDLTVTVSDDGAGFDPASVRAEALGLISMEERAETVGAALHWTTSRDGTTVTVRLPLDGTVL